jgi:hypothetical protein
MQVTGPAVGRERATVAKNRRNVAMAQVRREKFSVNVSTTGRHTGWGRSWPMPSITTYRAPGMAAATARPLPGRSIGSCEPCNTTVGAVMALL